MSFQKHCPGCFHEKGGLAVCLTCGYDEAAPRAPLLLPHGIVIGGQYRVGRVLGRPGGFGITYLGWDINLQQRVAIKEYLPRDLVNRLPGSLDVAVISAQDRSAFDGGREHFLREARIVAQFDHPSVVRVRNFFNANGTAYMVMDYYEGMSLGEYLTQVRTTIEPDLAVRLMRPVLEGLQYVHERGVVHRDLKPHNIYLATIGRLIVLDFGAARDAQLAGDGARSMSVVLTEGYAPLEQYQRRAAQGPWTDVYGAAATLYRMITGRAPTVVLDRLGGSDPLEAGGFTELPESLRPAMRKALAVRPEDRYRSALAFERALDACLDALAAAGAAPARPAAEPAEGAPARLPAAVAPTAAHAIESEADSPRLASRGTERAWPTTVAPRPAEPESPAPPAPAPPSVPEPAARPSAPPSTASAPCATTRTDEHGLSIRRDLPILPPRDPALAEVSDDEILIPRDSRRMSWRWLLGAAALVIGVAASVVYSLNRQSGDALTATAPRGAAAPPQADAADAPAEQPRALGEAVQAARTADGRAPLLLPRMVALPGGTARIGNLAGGGAGDERPPQSLRIAPLRIGVSEVTVAQYGQFLEESGYRNPLWANYPCESAGGRFPTWDDPGYPQSGAHPAVCASWRDAQAYADWLGEVTGEPYRLPTEAEWEYAARAGTVTRFWWGERYDASLASCAGCPGARTAPQAALSWPANPWGLHEMLGNVAEWTCSAYASYRTGQLADCAPAASEAPRAVRGGSWLQPEEALRSAARSELSPYRRNVWTGFRVVVPAAR